MAALTHERQSRALEPAHAFDIIGASAQLRAADGGYTMVHESARLQICVYALVGPEPDHQRVNADDKLYIALEGTGMLDVDGEQLELREGHAAFIPAGARHCFSAYEHLTVLAILTAAQSSASTTSTRPISTTTSALARSGTRPFG